jgi:hypothetical protein
MKNRNNMFLSLWNQSLSLPSNFANVMEDQFYHWLKMLTTNLHYVRAFLNPYSLGEAYLHDDIHAMEILKRVLWKNTSRPQPMFKL